MIGLPNVLSLRLARALAWLVFSIAIAHHKPAGAGVIERPELSASFEKRQIAGTFVLLRHTGGQIVVNNKRAERPLPPASTFKIANSLIALDTGAVGSVDDVVEYGGQPQPIKAWERDMSLRDAIQVSNVPVFQNVARRIGRSVYRNELKKLNFGNAKVGDDVTRFWLDGPLMISALDQARFLARLARLELPMSESAQRAVHDITVLARRNGRTLHGKTGWTRATKPDTGWFVGWINDGKGAHAFALNMNIYQRGDARFRREITLELLEALGVY